MGQVGRFVLGVTLVYACALGQSVAADVRGHVDLFADGQPLRAAEAAEAIVYFRPRRPQPVAALPEPVVMSTQRKQFVPRIVAITVGSAVRFPNTDPILHNVFSTSPNNAFDMGLYGPGEGSTHQFVSAGLVKVYCNVHHAMFGFVLVLDTPHFARPDAQGNFELRDVGEEEGELVVFHDRALPYRQTLTPHGVTEVNVRLDLNKRKVPPHMNKFGKPYRGGSNDSYR
jgi:plastocyanin